MHEASLVDALFDQVDQSLIGQPAGTLRLLRVRVGELAGVEPELFRIAFDVLREQRGHPRASLEVVQEEAVWRCSACVTRLPRGSILRCACGGEVELIAGGDIILDRIELEVPDV